MGAALILAAFPAMAQQPAGCDERATIVANLLKQYGEQPVSAGLASNGQLLEVLASPDGKTFSVLLTAPGGPTCMMAAGEGWYSKPPAPVLRLQRPPHDGERMANRPPLVVPIDPRGLQL